MNDSFLSLCIDVLCFLGYSSLLVSSLRNYSLYGNGIRKFSLYTLTLLDPRHAGAPFVEREYVFLAERKRGKIGREVKSKVTEVMESGMDNE
jgi:hypothetical protein